MRYLINKLESIDIPLIIGGDANVYFSQLDYDGPTKFKNNVYRNEWLKFFTSHRLCDVWRAFNIEKREYTWRDRTK